MGSEYWLWDWIDEHGVRSNEDAKRILATDYGLRSLQDMAEAADGQHDEALVGKGTFIVGGHGVDLTGEFGCLHPSCRRLEVDELMSHVWHYFDVVVAADDLTHQIAAHWEFERDEILFKLPGKVEALLYLRQIGAESLVAFRSKPMHCLEHWRKHVGDIGLERALQVANEVTAELVRDASIEVDPDSPEFRLDHPLFEHTIWGALSKRAAKGSVSAKRRAAAKMVVERRLASLVIDAGAAHGLDAPLGTTMALDGRFLHGREPNSAELAFRLQLPVLNGVRPKTLVEIRQQHRDLFERFQRRLRLAAEERVKLSNDAQKLANEIREDLIQPELNSIRDCLNATRRAAAKKTLTGLVLGTFLTAYGLVAGSQGPLGVVPISAGLVVSATAIWQSLSKAEDEKRDISLRDMYFLWKAVEHQHSAGD